MCKGLLSHRKKCRAQKSMEKLRARVGSFSGSFCIGEYGTVLSEAWIPFLEFVVIVMGRVASFIAGQKGSHGG